MTYSPQLNGTGIEFARITLPNYKRWHADIRLMGGVTDISGVQTLTFAGIAMTGSIFRTKSEAGSRALRMVGGANGLGTVLPAKAYYQQSGVLLSTVARDIAAASGETIVVDVDRSLGSFWSIISMTAGQALDALTGSQWWMDLTGTIHTSLTTRTTTPIASTFMAKKWRGAQGVYEIVPDAPSDWTPGRSFANALVSGTISRTELDMSKDKLEMRVLVTNQGATTGDRLIDPFVAAVDDVTPQMLYYLRWPYTVATVSAGPPVTMTLTSNDARAPDLQGVVLWPGPSGAWAVPPVGAAVRVAYTAANPAMPEVVALDPYHAPTTVTVGGTVGNAAAARVGDTVTITAAEILSAAMVAGSTPVTITNPLQCKITSGSGIVGVGG